MQVSSTKADLKSVIISYYNEQNERVIFCLKLYCFGCKLDNDPANESMNGKHPRIHSIGKELTGNKNILVDIVCIRIIE